MSLVTSFKNKLTDVLSGKSLCVQRTRWRGPAPDPLNATEENRKLLSEEQAGGSQRFLRSPHVAHRLYFMEMDWPAGRELPRAATSDPRPVGVDAPHVAFFLPDPASCAGSVPSRPARSLPPLPAIPPIRLYAWTAVSDPENPQTQSASLKTLPGSLSSEHGRNSAFCSLSPQNPVEPLILLLLPPVLEVTSKDSN